MGTSHAGPSGGFLGSVQCILRSFGGLASVGSDQKAPVGIQAGEDGGLKQQCGQTGVDESGRTTENVAAIGLGTPIDPVLPLETSGPVLSD